MSLAICSITRNLPDGTEAVRIMLSPIPCTEDMRKLVCEHGAPDALVAVKVGTWAWIDAW